MANEDGGVTYTVKITARATKDLRRLTPDVVARILSKIRALGNNLQGDVKRLTDFEPQYRLRVGDWRVLFDVVDGAIVVYRVVHRSEAY